jgi:DNA-binding transcriptional LysR family regulator
LYSRNIAGSAVDVRHVRYFLAVFDELHFGRAAGRLHMTQPALSQAIRRLEQELGVELFVRTSRSVAPTEAGRSFAAEARKALSAFEEAVREARRAGGVGAALRIGWTETVPLEGVSRFVRAFHLRVSDVETEVVHIPYAELIRLLRDGDLDLALLHHALDDPELDVEPVFAGERLAVLLPREHPLAGRPTIGPEDLRETPVMLAPREANPPLYDHVQSRLAAAGFTCSALRDAGGWSERELTFAVAEGGAAGIVSASALDVTMACSLVTVRPLKPPLALPDIVLAWRANPPRHLARLLRGARAAARALRGEPRPRAAGS